MPKRKKPEAAPALVPPSLGRRLSGEDATAVRAVAADINQKKAFGIIRLDYPYPVGDGDVDNPDSFPYKTIQKVVKGFTFEMLLSGKMTKVVEKRFIEAIKYLEDAGAHGISGDCGYMYIYEELARKHATVPVFMSSLIQLPMIDSALADDAKILVMTSNGANFDKIKSVLKNMCGHVLPKMIIAGCENVPYFDAVARAEKVEESKVAPLLLDLAKKYIAKDKKIKVILFECTQLPAFANCFRMELKMPVYDIVTCLDFYHSARDINTNTRVH